MLIRSQSKEELLCFGKTCVLRIYSHEGRFVVTFCLGCESKSMVIGRYETAERCKEVLDEIQDFYKRSKVAKIYSMKPMFVYQMPEE